LWRVRFDEHSATARPLFGHGLVYINTGFGKAQLLAVKPSGKGDVTNSHVAWRQRQGVPSKPSQLLIGDLIYMIHDSGVATCLDAKTGEIVWRERVGGKFTASPLYADGRIYLFDQDGKTTVIAPGREYKQLAENHLDAGFMASPATADGALYLRTEKALYRIEK
jgi:outer membrane protein assembly factor BamB